MFCLYYYYDWFTDRVLHFSYNFPWAFSSAKTFAIIGFQIIWYAMENRILGSTVNVHTIILGNEGESESE